MRLVFFLTLLVWIVPSEGSSLLPPAQSYRLLSAPPFELAKKGEISFPKEHSGLSQVANWLAVHLKKKGLDWKGLSISNGEKRDNGAAIQLHILTQSNDIPLPTSDRRFKEAYRIEIGYRVKIFAGGVAGAYYAAARLLELLGDNRRLRAALLIDYPDFRWRGVVINPKNMSCGDLLDLSANRQNEWLDCMDRKLETFAAMRLNLLGIISPVFHRLNDVDMQLLEQFFQRARMRNIEPMPVVDSKLWGVPKPSLNVNAIEGIFHKRESFVVRNGELISETPSKNLLVIDSPDHPGNIIFKNALFSPRWRIASERKQTKPAKRYIVIQLPKENVPWKSLAIVGDKGKGTLVPVGPGQYYELGVLLRSDRAQKSRIWVGVEEYDGQRNRIKNLNKNPAKIFSGRKWAKRWIPVFTSKRTHYLSLRFAPENLSDATIHLSLSNIELRPMRGQLVNVLVNGETAPLVESENRKTIFKEGKDYELESVMVKEWRNTSFDEIKQLQIRILPESHIVDKERIKISFDSLPLEYWSIPRSKYSPASRYTYMEYRRIFQRLTSLSPVFIHVAMDEHAGGLNRDSRSLKSGMSNRELFVGYLNTLARLLRSHGDVPLPNGKLIPGIGASNITLIIWDDMLNPWHNGGNRLYQVPFGGQAGKIELLAKDSKSIELNHSIYLASWWYPDDDKYGKVAHTPRYYRKGDYRYFAVTWYQSGGIANWMKMLAREEPEGLIATTWNEKREGINVTACLGWNTNNKDYCMHL